MKVVKGANQVIKNRKIANICLSAGVLLFIVASLTLSQQSAQTVLGGSPPIYQHDNLAGREHRPLYVPGQLIVKFKKDIPLNMRRQVLAANQVTFVKALLLPDYALVEFDPAKDVRLMAALLLDDPSIESAEPNYYRYADFTPNDPYYAYQWHFPMIQMPSAWDRSNGAGVTVAVIDTGVAYEDYGPYVQAPDLAGTTFVAGWDFVNEDSHPNDDNSHGTHVAGTIAQTTNNGIGVAGIAYGANIMPLKVLDSEGVGSDQWVADGIVWAVNHGAQVINLSLGGPAPSSVLESAVNYAYNNGVTVIAAAGNDNSDVSYPAAYENCIAVGAVRYDETRSYYSNYGSALDLVAPGGDVYVDQNGDGYGDGVLQQTFDPLTQDYTDFGYWFLPDSSFNDNDSWDYKIKSPIIFGVGAAFTLFPNLIIAGDIEYSDWSQLKYLSEPLLGTKSESNINFKTNYQATTQYRVGAEFTVPLLNLQLRGGFFNQPSPLKNAGSSADRRYFTAGVGLLLDKQVKVDLAWLKGWWKDESYFSSEIPSITEKIDIDKILATVAFRF